MADQKRWFKVWCAIMNDPAFLALPLDALGRWVLLGAWMAEHGDKGTLKAKEAALRYVLRIEHGTCVLGVLDRLPNVRVQCGRNDNADDNVDVPVGVALDVPTNDNAEFTVIIERWAKYQLDSTGYERLKKYRKRMNDNGLREEKTKRRVPPKSPAGMPDGFAPFWDLYPRRAAKAAALKAWRSLAPTNELRETIMKALALQVERDFSKREPDKVPHPATWINGRRWEDDLPEKGAGATRHAPQYERL